MRCHVRAFLLAAACGADPVPPPAPEPIACGPGHPDACVRDCEAGDDVACDSAIAMFLAHGRDRAASLCRDLCESGRHRWCPSYAFALVHGDGVPRDEARGRELFERYCADDPVACSEYGSLSASGTGVPQDSGLAHLLLGLACDSDEATACRELAAMLDAACDARHGPSCNERGVMFAQGRGPTKDGVPDPAAAFARFDRACATGDANGCSNLARAYEQGIGVAKDPQRAAEHAALACRLGNADACPDDPDP